MIITKDNIYIEGFNTSIAIDFINQGGNTAFIKSNIIYAGKTSDIPEDIAKECVIQYGIEKGELIDEFVVEEDILYGFKNYKEGFGALDFQTAKESIQSAVTKEDGSFYEFIIIIKK